MISIGDGRTDRGLDTYGDCGRLQNCTGRFPPDCRPIIQHSASVAVVPEGVSHTKAPTDSNSAIADFFAHPYHSWERGLNENTNGLIRQHFPKGTDLLNVTPEQVTFAINQMNHRPRKCLDWKTPHEVFFGQPSTWAEPALNVALRM